MRVELCPECGSGKVSRISPLGDDCKCDGCGWAGKEGRLMRANVDEDALSAALQVAQMYLVTLTEEASMPIGKAIVRSGLLSVADDKAVLGRVLKAAVMGAHRATLDEIGAMQKELTSGIKS